MYMNYFDSYIICIFIVKIVFITLAITKGVLKVKSKDNKLIATIDYWKERIEFVFITLMSILLIYIFYPRANHVHMINGESKLLFYLFGFILLFTAKWELFIKDSIAFKHFQSVIGNEGTR